MTDYSRSHVAALAPGEFLHMRAPEQALALLAAPVPERRAQMRLLPLDDAADVIQAAPESERVRLLDLLDDVPRREVVALLAYSEDVAGGLMDPRFVRLRPELTVDEGISYMS